MTHRKTFLSAPLCLCGSIALLVLALLPGCELFGFASANFMPRKKVEAVYKPINQATLIFVDDPRRALPSMQAATLVADHAARELRENEVVTEIIPSSRVAELRADTPDFDTLPIDKIGSLAGAKQVVYVLIDAFDTGGEEQDLRRPVAAARVKVVHVASGRRLFPERAEHGVTTMLRYKQDALDASSHGGEALLAQKLAENLGRDIALQFYDHPPREIGSGFED